MAAGAIRDSKRFGDRQKGKPLAKTLAKTAFSYTLSANQNIFPLLNIPMDETKPTWMFWLAMLSSIESRFPGLS